MIQLISLNFCFIDLLDITSILPHDMNLSSPVHDGAEARSYVFRHSWLAVHLREVLMLASNNK